MAFHLVHDIETLNLDRGNPNIVAVGAVLVCEHTGVLHEPFYASLHFTAIDFSNIDPHTFRWWMQQNNAAQALTFDSDKAYANEFGTAVRNYYGKVFAANEIIGVWGNGSDFDNVMIKKRFGATLWSYKLDRCLRTLRALTPHIVKPWFDGIEHYALDDARNEAIDLYNRLGAIHNGH